MKIDLFDMLQSQGRETAPNMIQFFDQYNAKFNCYDRSNQQMHGMAWQFASDSGNYHRIESNNMNSVSLQPLSKNGTRTWQRSLRNPHQNFKHYGRDLAMELCQHFDGY